MKKIIRICDAFLPRVGSWSKENENGNENGKKAVGLDKQNKNYATVSLLLYISLPSLHDVPQRQTY